HAMGMSAKDAHTVLSVAASSACGLRANFGTDVKPLHVGFAAAAAVRAVLLVQSGANASDDVWGGAGFFRAFTGDHPASPLDWQPGGPLAIEAPGFEHKRFPSCYMSHRLIAGVLGIRARQTAHHGEPVDIAVEVARNGTSALKYVVPHTGLQGKFSGHYCAAAAWTDGEISLSTFAESAVQRADLRAALERVVLRERADENERLESAPVHVTVSGQGWSDRVTVDVAPGSLGDPMSRDELLGKWRDGAAWGAMTPGDDVAVRLLDESLSVGAAGLLLPLRDGLCAAVERNARQAAR
ncbi:MAG: 2-methylcitrate dehydratase, partial [Comamonadaceae bacterium]